MARVGRSMRGICEIPDLGSNAVSAAVRTRRGARRSYAAERRSCAVIGAAEAPELPK